MTTVLVPSSGAAPLFTQGGVGTTPGYSALDVRRANSGSLQEGVFGASTFVTAGGVAGVQAADFMVTQRGSGANLSVDINMPAGGCAYVQGDTIAGQGLYRVDVHSSVINEAIAAADVTNPRIDQVILEVQDDTLDGSGGNLAQTRVLTGTPTSGATLDNRTGAAALPGSALLLADVRVAAGATSIANSAIRDRRTWARGAYYTKTGDFSGNLAVVQTGTPFRLTAFDQRVECSGAPLEIEISGRAFSTVAGASAIVCAMATGGETPSAGGGSITVTSPTANEADNFSLVVRINPGAGTHVFGVGLYSSSGTAGANLENVPSSIPRVAIREFLRPLVVSAVATG